MADMPRFRFPDLILLLMVVAVLIARDTHSCPKCGYEVPR